jgi:hypothetical protein
VNVRRVVLQAHVPYVPHVPFVPFVPFAPLVQPLPRA